MIELTREEFYSLAREHYGDDSKNWMFICPLCNNTQSMNSLLESIESNGKHISKRYGNITLENIKKIQPKIDQECLSPDCDYVSYGLISGNLKIEDCNYLELVINKND